MTHTESLPAVSWPSDVIAKIQVVEMCDRCGFRPVTVYRGFRFVNGMRLTVREGSRLCRFCR